MLQRIILFTISIFVAGSLWGQNFKSIPIIDQSSHSTKAEPRDPCALSPIGGPIDLSAVNGMSNSTPAVGETIFLCAEDNIVVSDLGAGTVLAGDPNLATQAFVGLAIYTCQPTVDGPDLATVVGDCIFNPSGQSDNINLAFDFDDPTSGVVTIANTTNMAGERITELINGGAPFQWWYAPITVDDVDDKYEGMPRGSCVSVGVDQAFSVVYLNPIEFVTNAIGVDFVYPFGGNGSQGRFNIAGGLPEFDNTATYDITITKVDNPSVTGRVISGPAGHRSFPEIEVPEPGTYRIDVSDGQGCSFSRTVVMDQVPETPSTLEFYIEGPETVEVDREFCVEVKATDFDSIAGSTIIIDIDTTFDVRIGDLIDNQWQLNLSDNQVIASLFSLAGEGVSYPRESTLFTLCLTPRAENECAILDFEERSNNGTIAETVNAKSEIVNIPDNPDNNLKVQVIDPDKVTAVISELKNACPGSDNGSFQLNTLGGNPPFEVSLTGPKNDGPGTIPTNDDFLIFEDLPAGSYDLLIRELNTGEFTTSTVEILEANLGVTIDVTSQITCNGFSDGIMTAEVSVGGITETDLSEYDFRWVNDAGDTISRNESADNLPFGTYEVFVESNNGCRQNARSSISQPAMLSTVPDATPSSCSGVDDGTIRLTGTAGGNGPYDFEWSNGVTGQNNVNIESGEYGYTVTDAGGCRLVDTFLLTARTELVINVPAKIDVSCFGLDDGSIDITGSQRGTPVNGDYNFVWSANATSVDNSVVQSSLVSDLAADTYSVTLTNSGLPPGCQAVQDFVINEPDSLMVERVDITNVSSCSLTNPDGGISATFTGGTIITDYSYEWSDTAGMVLGNTATLTGQPSGELILTVTDDNGCETTIDTAIGTPPPPVIQFFDGADLACATDNADLSVIAVPGRPNVDVTDYMWSHDASITGANANNVGPGMYTVTVIDSDGCASAAEAEVTSPPAIRTSQIDFKPACFASDDGAISVDIVGGSNTVGQDYDFEWSFNNDVLSTISKLLDAAPEAYNLKVTDVSGCEFDTLITLGSLPRIVVDFPQADISGVACFDTPASQCNGTAVVNAGYEGSGDGIFTFTWQATSESIGATNTFNSNSLCAGFQQVRVVDTSGCETIDSVLIPSPDEIVLVTNSLTDVSCFGETDGAVTIGATGGNGGFTFAWSDGSTDLVRNDLSAQVYDITIIDQSGCTGNGQLEITEPQELVATIDLDETNNIICEGDQNGRITVNVMGGNSGPLIYNWTNNVSAVNSAAGLESGTYLIDIEDTRGCTAQTNYTVLEPTPISGQVEWDPIQCNGFQTGIRIANISGGNPGAYTFSVDDSPARPIDETITEFGGERKISFFDAEGCRVDSIYNIEQPRPLEVNFTESLVEVDLGSSIDLDLEINGDLPIADIFWAQDGEPVDSSFRCAFLPCDNPTVNPLNNTVYTVFVTDANDCMAEASITVNVDKNRNVYIPNVFAPNNAGFDTNDRFAVFTGSGVSKINYAKVFNRWGTMVADLTERRIDGSNATTEVWDGFIKGEKANQGVYIYIVEVEFIDNTVLLYRGDVALLR